MPDWPDCQLAVEGVVAALILTIDRAAGQGAAWAFVASALAKRRKGRFTRFLHWVWVCDGMRFCSALFPPNGVVTVGVLAVGVKGRCLIEVLEAHKIAQDVHLTRKICKARNQTKTTAATTIKCKATSHKKH